VSINGMPAGSRITPERDIDICGLCGTEEAMFQWRNPGVPLPPINERVPLDKAYDMESTADQWGRLGRLDLGDLEPPDG
jgi:hypothetical protein